MEGWSQLPFAIVFHRSLARSHLEYAQDTEYQKQGNAKTDDCMFIHTYRVISDFIYLYYLALQTFYDDAFVRFYQD